MSALTLSFAVKVMDAKWVGKDAIFQGVNTDTRKLSPGDLFVAIPGARVDGHDYISEAKTKGAVGLLISREVDTTLPTLLVPDTVKALGTLAKAYREPFQIPMIAVTGSCGKTTVKEMLSSILMLQGSVLSTSGNLNTEVGVPLTLLRLSSQHRLAVIEMGARQKGDVAYLMSLTKPMVSLITNAGAAHLEIFGSEKEIAEAKGEIFESLPSTGTAVINEDDMHAAYWKSLIKPTQRILTFGLKESADIRATQVILGSHFSEFNLVTDVDVIPIRLSIPGAHMVQNALAAAAAARAVQASLNDIKIGLEQFVPVTGRLQFKTGLEGATFIDDTYNANPVSMRAALSVLAKYPGPKIFVMGDMFELGKDEWVLHQEMGKEAKRLGIDKLLGVGKLTAAAVKEFGEGAMHYPDKISLIHALRSGLSSDATVLVKGSRGMRMEEVILELTKNHREISC